MEVDPQALADTAARLSELARTLHAALPSGWMSPAGADAGSAAAAGYFNGLAEGAYNSVAQVLDAVAAHSHHVGAAAADYTDADAEGARTLGGSAGGALTNPVPVPATHASRSAPPPPVVSPDAVDPLTFAEQLRRGPGAGAARAYAASIRAFLDGAHAAALEGLDSAGTALSAWTPVGTAAAAQLAVHRGALERIGGGLHAVADGVDAYADAFQTAKDRHPTPQQILTTRKRLLAAMRAKNSAAIAAALAEFNEQNAVSAQTAGDYAAGLGDTAATTSQAAGATTPTGATKSGSGGNGGNDTSMLTSMLPSLLSSLTGGANGLLSQSHTNTGDLGDLGYDDPTGLDYGPLPTIPTFDGGGGGPSVPSVPSDPALDLGPGGLLPALPTGASPTALTTTALPRTPVIDQLQTASNAAASTRAGSSPYMPYMPMSPGMGGAGASGGGDRNRVVAWHPDRLMYVDDTPHTEAVIGEKPTIAPAITPATPAQQTPTPTGGTA